MAPSALRRNRCEKKISREPMTREMGSNGPAGSLRGSARVEEDQHRRARAAEYRAQNPSFAGQRLPEIKIILFTETDVPDIREVARRAEPIAGWSVDLARQRVLNSVPLEQQFRRAWRQTSLFHFREAVCQD